MRRLFQCDGGKSSYARASSSASSRIASVLGRHPSSMSQATWYMAATVTASRPRARGRDAVTVAAMYHVACDMLEGCRPRTEAILEEAELDALA